MKISVITLFPDMIAGFVRESIIKRAVEKGLAEVELIQLRDFATDSYGTVDGKPYGGGVGMVLRVDVLYRALEAAKTKAPGKKPHVVLTSAKGAPYQQETALRFSKMEHLIIVAGHYEGVDERFLHYVDEEVSLGDFVMTGGEIAAAAIADSVIRLIPGVLKKDEATRIESFSETGGKTLLEYPQYTRPEEFDGKKVPDILLSGHHREIEKWRAEMAVRETKNKRPDLLT
jgi:tRNA (guanine37-N1)-methyltransferase